MKLEILTRARKVGTPIIDGDEVTFVWQGKHAPRLVGDFTDWLNGPAIELESLGPKLWGYRTRFPADAYIEYAYLDGKKRVADPLNRQLTPNGVGEFNHSFAMPGYQASLLWKRQKEPPQGSVTQHEVKTLKMAVGKTRSVYLYQPPVTEPCPLLVVWDGNDYLKRAHLPTILDNLIAQKRIRPLAAAMIANHKKGRAIEYSCSEATLGFLHYCVLPLARKKLKLLDEETHPGAYGVMGASAGGLLAVFTACRIPQLFGNLLSQSGSFGYGMESVVFDLVNAGQLDPVKTWLEVGIYDFAFILTANRKMHELMVKREIPVGYNEYPAGHNYPAWRNQLWRGLEHLFPA